MDWEQAEKKLGAVRQEQILSGCDKLNEKERENLFTQIEQTDFSFLSSVGKGSDVKGTKEITPIPVMTLDDIREQKSACRQIGMQMIREGKVAAVMLAGGMGTRLGSDKPKGMFDIGITRPLSIFSCQIKNLLDVVNEAGTFVYLLIMTSEKNHKSTVDFFEQNNYFGYDKNYVRFFQQEMAPCTDFDGKVLLEKKDKIATSPNGNGGWFFSLAEAKLTDLIEKEGIEYLNVFAVDNVMQRIIDPVFIGATKKKEYAVGAKVVQKIDPDEKVGVICLENGHPSIAEYYELTDTLRNTLDKNNEPVYRFGVILNYLFRVKDLKELTKSDLPVHAVKKKIPYLGTDGTTKKPDAPNGFKYETLILDLIRLTDNCLPFEVEREKEFAPIKNKTGTDSVESAQKLLEKNGVKL